MPLLKEPFVHSWWMYEGFACWGGFENGKLLDPGILVLATAAAWTMAPQAIGCPPLALAQMSKGVDNGGGGADDSMDSYNSW
jgi:hypothetical protein